VAAKLTESLGQSVLVENRRGGIGQSRSGSRCESARNGYTLFVGVSTNTINENTFAHQLQIKPSRDLVASPNWSKFAHQSRRRRVSRHSVGRSDRAREKGSGARSTMRRRLGSTRLDMESSRRPLRSRSPTFL